MDEGGEVDHGRAHRGGASEEEALDYEYPELYPADRPEWQKRSRGSVVPALEKLTP